MIAPTLRQASSIAARSVTDPRTNSTRSPSSAGASSAASSSRRIRLGRANRGRIERPIRPAAAVPMSSSTPSGGGRGQHGLQQGDCFGGSAEVDVAVRPLRLVVVLVVHPRPVDLVLAGGLAFREQFGGVLERGLASAEVSLG